MEGQHAEKWRDYDQSSPEQKESFFKCIRTFKSTVNSHLGGLQTQLQLSVNKEIFDVLIGEILFDPSGDGEVASSRERALAALPDFAAADKIQDYDGKLQTDRYGIKIFNPVQFKLTVDYIAVGITFQRVGRIICATKEQTGLAQIGIINEATVC